MLMHRSKYGQDSHTFEERKITDEMRQCAANWRPEQSPLISCVIAARAAIIESGMNTPGGNPVNAASEPADLRVPAELSQAVETPKQRLEETPRL